MLWITLASRCRGILVVGFLGVTLPAKAEPIRVIEGAVNVTPNDMFFSLSLPGFDIREVSEAGPILTTPLSSPPRLGDIVDASFETHLVESRFVGSFRFDIPPVQLVDINPTFAVGAALRFDFTGVVEDRSGIPFDLTGVGRGVVLWSTGGAGPFYDLQFESAGVPTPEPSSGVLVGVAVARLLVARRRRTNVDAAAR